ncbi:hypothetical protein OG504_45500 [Streptomyces sp. NBC_00986]|nr:hypothetical protein OG504_45500 [Streptomyces sp. NBC_00986]
MLHSPEALPALRRLRSPEPSPGIEIDIAQCRTRGPNTRRPRLR